jgi:hypothetical protein
MTPSYSPLFLSLFVLFAKHFLHLLLRLPFLLPFLQTFLSKVSVRFFILSKDFFVCGEIRGQFHQHFGAKRKCAGSHSLPLVGAVQFHLLYPTLPLHPTRKYAQLHSVLPMPYASKISVNPLAQKLHIKCW